MSVLGGLFKCFAVSKNKRCIYQLCTELEPAKTFSCQTWKWKLSKIKAKQLAYFNFECR